MQTQKPIKTQVDEELKRLLSDKKLSPEQKVYQFYERIAELPKNERDRLRKAFGEQVGDASWKVLDTVSKGGMD